MSSANSATALAVASLPWQRPSPLFFPSPFSPLQTPLSCRKFLCLSLSRLVSSRSHLVAGAAPATALSSGTETKRVLIINTNSGGHAVIGFYFARELLGAGHEVTILTVGDEGSDKMKKPPFTRFSELVSAGARTVWGSPADVGKVVGSATFDVVLDNNGKDLGAVKPVADWAKSSGVQQFLFISSAGIYKTTDEIPHVEGDPVKDDAGHVAVERYIADLSFGSWAIFRPQYMIGYGNNKDCEEWFFDRIVRGRPVPIPGSGMELTNISHVRDLSSMLSLAVADPIASSQKIFNCVSDRAVTANGLVKLCAQAAGLEAKIIHYDPKSVGVDAKKAFPFRNMVVFRFFVFGCKLFHCSSPVCWRWLSHGCLVQHFYAEPRAAKEILGWTSTTNLLSNSAILQLLLLNMPAASYFHIVPQFLRRPRRRIRRRSSRTGKARIDNQERRR